jgi:hypothetical protein
VFDVCCVVVYFVFLCTVLCSIVLGMVS